MNDFFQYIGSFATIWLATWLFLFFALWAVYPVLRRFLLTLHPQTASSLMLALLSIPCLASLLSTTLLFSPYLEANFFINHTHTAECHESFPFLNSPWLIGTVLGLSAFSVGAMVWQFLANFLMSRKLLSQLSVLGDRRQNWHLLPNRESLVFTLGWLKNRIFITEGLLDKCSDEDIDIILAHENEHIRRKDNIRLLLARLFTLFVPARLARRYMEDLHLFTEAACDFATARRFGQLDVADTLLRVQRLVPDRFVCLDGRLVSAFTGAEVESRIEMLLSDGTSPRALKYGSFLFIVVMLLLTFVLIDPLHHGIEWLVAVT